MYAGIAASADLTEPHGSAAVVPDECEGEGEGEGEAGRHEYYRTCATVVGLDRNLWAQVSARAHTQHRTPQRS